MTAPARLLFVCTANRVRSPYAEVAARRLAAEHHLAVEVSSAGFLSDGLPAFEEMVELARDRGMDLDGHRSRQVSIGLLAGADLVVAMTGRHVVDLVGLDPGAVRRVVTLRELATACEAGGPPWEPEALRAWIEPVTARELTALLGGERDVADPAGGPFRGYRSAAEEIERLLALVTGATGR